MPFYDGRTMDGVYSVRETAGFMTNYRYAEERMMRMMAGWIALTPELPVKLEMARQVYEDALHANALGKRLAELRSQEQVSKPANPAFVAFMDAIEDKEEWDDTIERLVGIYRVLKPHLISNYSAHLSAANPVFESPTRKILITMLEEEKNHTEHGMVLLNDLLDSAEKHQRATSWQAHLEGLLASAGGVTGFPHERQKPKKEGRS